MREAVTKNPAEEIKELITFFQNETSYSVVNTAVFKLLTSIVDLLIP